ncbi:hypothetical protein [Nodosilinea sp. P-1105]|uniref:hypothetical protein n=1 Tax=Nodosilinea sp. P-1105 TaxID=2546229 RepID=UPI00146F51AD|nr:hypothetical protein [Nodosilinea sp. P-1105]NMF83038.1 hypothetical protein [Nodosilinea sp. P-1105]
MSYYGHIVNSFPTRMQIGCYPEIFYPLYSLVPINRKLSVNKKTQIVIEGFPRSANTFAVLAFEQAQSQPVSIAHHMHVPAQVIRAAHWQIPTLVLIRQPQDAVASYVLRKPELSVRAALQCYIRFYKTVSRYQGSYVVATFEEIISQISNVVIRVNEHFRTEFTAATPTGDDLDSIFKQTEIMAKKNGMNELGFSRPSLQKENRKKDLIEIIKSPKYDELLGEAKAIYSNFLI